MSYADFLNNKRASVVPDGVDVDPDALDSFLHEWQRRIVAWSLQRARTAIFADCGLGKTLMQLEWSRHVPGPALILAPLSVAKQTADEARKIDMNAVVCRSMDDVMASLDADVWITNYEMVEHFDAAHFAGIVLDESSILKNHTGSTRNQLVDQWASTAFRLACTATPAPNDVTELTNHAEFLGRMPRNEMLAAYFVHDQDGWRIKGHAEEEMHRWMAGWAVAVRSPEDIGGDGAQYELPPLNIRSQIVENQLDAPDGQLFATTIGGVSDRAKLRRSTAQSRVARAAELVASSPDGQWIIWCGLNDEASAIAEAVDGAVNVEGSWNPEHKVDAFDQFKAGQIRTLVTKVSIAGFGMNFQNAHRMIFLGIGDSFEQYYQAIRRCWRFGQTMPVDVHIVTSDLETQIVDNVRRKESETSATTEYLVRHCTVPLPQKELSHA